ncbi:MAG: ADP compounds hydrolase NudE [Pseudomonadota bacterium]
MRLPQIREQKIIAESRFFKIEALDLQFSNGVERVYERLPAQGEQGVIVVAVNDADEVMLIREYAAGFHEFQLTLPKGSADPGESLADAARRELAEEIGFTARNVEFVKNLTLAPGHMGFTINVMFARDLSEHQLPADEPEPPEVVPWPVADLDELISGDQFNEARAIAALTLCRGRLQNLR